MPAPRGRRPLEGHGVNMIHQISLADCLEPTAPPARVLNLSVLDDVAFVRICKVDQDSRAEKHTEETADITVSLPSLLEALTILAQDAEREELRPLDSDGKTRETRLAGQRLIIAPASPVSAVGALTRHLRHTPPPKTAS